MRREVWLLSFLSRPKEGNDRQNAGREDAEQIDIDTGRWQGEGVDGKWGISPRPLRDADDIYIAYPGVARGLLSMLPYGDHLRWGRLRFAHERWRVWLTPP